jgi:DNA-binding response OmpR family regulator
MRALVAEDDDRLRGFLRKGLQEHGAHVDEAADGDEALWMARADVYDVIVLDIMLPARSGFDVIRQLRAEGVGTPIICLTARDGLADKVVGLELGADDYLVKPFEFAELVARIRALDRRAEGLAARPLACGDLTLDPVAREATRHGRRIELTPREYALLECLLRRQGMVVSRASIMDHVWGVNSDALVTVVDVFINRLRNKVDYPFARRLIHTVRGFGYRLAEEGEGP